MRIRSPLARRIPLGLFLTLLVFRGAPGVAQTSEEANAELFEVLSHILVKGEDVTAALEKGADPNATNERGYTALAVAAASGEKAAVEALLAGGAEVDGRSAHEITPLMLAMGEDEHDLVPVLARAGADIEAVDVDGWTPVIWAAHNDSGRAFRTIKKRNPRLDVLDKEGWSALTTAVRRASRGMIELLVEAGAKWTEPVGGVPMLQLAAATGDLITVEEVLEHFPDLEVRGPQGETPLIAAASLGHREVVADLLRLGADPSAKDAAGRTALDHAREQGDPTVIALLGGGYEAHAPEEETVVELECEPLGGKLRVGLEIEGETLRAAVYYPKVIHSYFGPRVPGKIEAEVGLHFDVDHDRDTGLGEASAEHPAAVGSEWSAVFTEVIASARYNQQPTPAERYVQVWMYKEGEEMSSWDMDDYSAETTMDLDRASFELPFAVIGLAPNRAVRIGIDSAACPSAGKVIEVGSP